MMIADLAVVTARLPYVDRSTLSRAWYDALHLAHEALPPGVSPAGRSTLTSPRYSVSASSASNVSAKNVAVAPCALRNQSRQNSAIAERPHIHAPPVMKKRCAQSAAPLLPPPKTQHAQQQTAIVHLPGGERICLILRAEKQGVRVIALCAENLRPRVSLALSAVQRMLASEGLVCHLSVGGEVS